MQAHNRTHRTAFDTAAASRGARTMSHAQKSYHHKQPHETLRVADFFSPSQGATVAATTATHATVQGTRRVGKYSEDCRGIAAVTRVAPRLSCILVDTAVAARQHRHRTRPRHHASNTATTMPVPHRSQRASSPGRCAVEKAEGAHGQQRRRPRPQWLPMSSATYNHYQRHTAFKRGVFSTRRRTLAEQLRHAQRHMPPSTQQQQRLTTSSPPSSPCASVEEEEADVGAASTASLSAPLVSPPYISAAPRTSSPTAVKTCDHLAPVVLAAQRVRQLESLYSRLDAAMQRRALGLAGRLRRMLRQQRQRLARELRRNTLTGDSAPMLRKSTTPAVQVAQTNVCDSEALRQTNMSDDAKVLCISAPSRMPSPPTPMQTTSTMWAAGPQDVYCCFCPEQTVLGVGRHKWQWAIDQRRARHPRRLSDEAVQALVAQCADMTLRMPQQERQLAGETAHESGCDTVNEADESSVAAETSHVPPSWLFVAHYCRNVLTDSLDDLVFTTLQSLYQEQRTLRERQPRQFKARQRYVLGLRETLKYLRSGRTRLVLLAADLEVGGTAEAPVGRGPHSLDEALASLRALCQLPQDDLVTAADANWERRRVPCLTCMSRRRLSYALFAKGSAVSCVGILAAEKSLPLVRALEQYGQRLCLAYETYARAHTSTTMTSGETSLVHVQSVC